MGDTLTQLRDTIDEQSWEISTRFAAAVQQVLTEAGRLVNDGRESEALELLDQAGDACGSVVSRSAAFLLPDDALAHGADAAREMEEPWDWAQRVLRCDEDLARWSGSFLRTWVGWSRCTPAGALTSVVRPLCSPPRPRRSPSAGSTGVGTIP